MKMKTTKEWLLKNAERDENLEVGAGFLTAEKLNAVYRSEEESVLESRLTALATLVNLSRRSHRLTLEDLAQKADIDLEELICIEKAIPVHLNIRTLHNLSAALKLPPKGLLKLSGAIVQRDECFTEQALRFVARAQPEAKPSKQEIRVLEEYVKFLAEDRGL